MLHLGVTAVDWNWLVTLIALGVSYLIGVWTEASRCREYIQEACGKH